MPQPLFGMQRVSDPQVRSNAAGRYALLLLLPFAVVLAGSANLAAQAPSSEASVLESVLTPGTTVWISDADGRERRARIVGMTGGVVSAVTDGERRDIPVGQITRVRARRSDSLLNGALIGAAAGVASGLALCRLTETWENCSDDAGPMVAAGALGAGIGIGIDTLIRGRRTIYETRQTVRLRVAPIGGRGARGVRLLVAF